MVRCCSLFSCEDWQSPNAFGVDHLHCGAVGVLYKSAILMVSRTSHFEVDLAPGMQESAQRYNL
eukprot:2343037-Rhodomonas_salina.1